MSGEAVVLGKRRPARNARLLFLAALMTCVGSPAARAAAPTVITDCGDDSQLQRAVASGGEIVFACSGTITLSSSRTLIISSNTTIDATGQQVALDGGGREQVFTVNSGVTLALNDITVQNGNIYVYGGALWNNGGSVIITNSTFVNNTVTGSGQGGGAIYSENGTLLITNSTFVNNSATGPLSNGGAIDNSGTLIILNSTFFDNSSQAGAIYNQGVATLQNTILAGSGSGGNCFRGVTDNGYNLSDDNSCGFTARGSQNNVSNLNLGSLASNGRSTQTIAPGAGSAAIGVIPAGTNGCATTITTDQRGAARPGNVNGTCTIGAVEYVSPVAATISDCTDDSQLQSAVQNGGRIVFACSGTIPISATLNLGAKNATLDATGQLVTLDGLVAHNSVMFNISGSTVTLNNLTIQNGGKVSAVYSESSPLTITNCTLSNNNGNEGGAIFNDGGALVVANSTFANNSASSGYGGAISNNGTMAIANSTFYGNRASEGCAPAAAIYSQPVAVTSQVTITNSTFFNNTTPAGEGGAIGNDGGAMTIENTILAANGGGNCVADSGSITDGGYNLDDDGSCGFSSANHSLSNNPNADLGTLSYNGGPTLTIPLNTGSVALSAIPFGSSGCGAIASNVNAIVLADERGVFRPQLTGTDALACDMGAVQSTQNQIAVTFNTNPANLAYTVGPASYTSQQTLTLPFFTQFFVSTAASQTGAGAQYTFADWSDGGAQTHEVTIFPPATGSLSYTANFNAFYLLTTAVNPSGAGTVSVSASESGNNGYYPAGTQITLTANANSGYGFTDWNGLAVIDNPLQFTLSAPTTETAYFSPYTNETGSVSVIENTGLVYSALLANPSSPDSPGGGTTVFTVTNTGGSTINGPVQLVLTNLPAGVTGANSSGTFNRSPYWTVNAGSLVSGASVLVTVQLNYPASAAVHTTPVVYSGSL